MTSHQLAITKASLSSALFRKDPVACDRNDIDTFHNLLHEAVQRCSPPNVQACKNWIAEHIVPSATRIAALGRFFCAYIDTLVDPTAEAPKKPKARRKRLHVLYIVNDILHHTLAQSPDNIFLQSFESSLKPLFASAAAVEKSTKHISKLNELIRIWEERQYVAAKTIDTLRDTMTGALADTSAHNAAMDIAPDPVKGPTLTKEVPYMLPSIHGDPAVPWYDLPASTWLPHMTPNSTKPMTPSMIKPLHMNAGPPDKALVDAVKGLLSNVDQIYAKDCSLDLQEHTDINELGEVVSLDEITGSVLRGEGQVIDLILEVGAEASPVAIAIHLAVAIVEAVVDHTVAATPRLHSSAVASLVLVRVRSVAAAAAAAATVAATVAATGGIVRSDEATAEADTTNAVTQIAQHLVHVPTRTYSRIIRTIIDKTVANTTIPLFPSPSPLLSPPIQNLAPLQCLCPSLCP
ncbi:Calcium homeostasis endoplasmic reticulum protein [Ceratocystis lukuohia]|uniref:Calcium homeostasis endoplasmic reticulum protein n=1 Tax=Ceratocystis lukuohia TaxID=2019550 RepID=A0ABR4MM34_9PEZI